MKKWTTLVLVAFLLLMAREGYGQSDTLQRKQQPVERRIADTEKEATSPEKRSEFFQPAHLSCSS